ncbi:FkbM family methyltransferase, partial [Niastella populi]|uniref:FkbM family methyltransferase n=1 Tax=Niastella populi TaxID=550983 RepID=UPI001054A279
EKSLIAYVVPSKNKAYTVNQILNAGKLELEFDAALYEMDNGVSMYAYNGSEVKWLYNEVFELKTYYNHGIIIPKDACIIDVGANVGAFSIFSLLTFENPRIYSFEPLAPIYSLLEKNISLYNGNVQIFNVGISDREEEAIFDFYPHTTIFSGRHSESYEVKDTIKKFIDNTQNAVVKTVTDEQMDELLKDRLVKKEYTCQLKTLSQVIRENAIAHIDLLKIDVETAELDVVNGIAEEDWAKIDQVVIEVYDDNDRLRKIEQILSSYGFTVSVYQSEDLKGTKLYDLYCIREKEIVEGKIEASFKGHWYSTNALMESVRQGLKDKLPGYMVPSEIVLLDGLPLTLNGKIDRKALLEIDLGSLDNKIEYIAPGTEQEKVLASVWSAVLKREGIGIRDSFYNLGGDSIKSIRVAARLKQYGYRLKVEHLLRTPVLEDLARLMELITQVTNQDDVNGEVVLTPIQEWFFNSSEIKVYDHFNQSVLLYTKQTLDSGILEKSIEDLTRHHDALRLVYKLTPEGWQQYTQDTRSKRYTFDFYDLSESDNAPGEMARLGEELQSGIKLSEGPLFKVAHFRLQDGDRLGLIIHHLVVDGISWRILLEDLLNLYSGYKKGEKPGLPSKTDSFQRWALLQKEYAAGKKIERERAYWQQVCDRQIAGLAQDKVVKEDQVALIDSSESFRLDKMTTELLQTRVHGVYNTEINDVLLTSLGLALKEVLSVDKSVLQMEGHGREEIIDGVDISRTVGWFTTHYPFVLDVSSSSDQAECLVAVKESLRRIPNKGIGYGILHYLSQERLVRKLTPQITFNYLGDFGANVSNDDGSLFEYASEGFGSEVSKENEMHTILDVSGMLVRGELGMTIRYSRSRYNAATIKKLAKSYKKNLQFLIEELAKSRQTHLTPSDLSFKGLSQEELSKLNSDNTLEDVYELSPLQEGIYYHWLAETSGSLYFEQISYRVRAKSLDIEKLEGAYDRLTARHAVLRTSFSTEYAGRSLQIVRKEVSGNFTCAKLDSQADQQVQVKLIKQQDRERGFDLSSFSQMRLHVIDLSDDEYEFIWSYHHILMDGWCVSVLINDFNELLSAAIRGSAVSLSPVVPYSNYINWLRTLDRERSLNYWKHYLSGYSTLAEIPFKAATADTTYVESSEHLQIEGDLFKKVDTLCTQSGITQNTFVQGVWGYLLSRYNNTNDVVFGAVVSGRPADLHGVEEMIGLFINTIPVRVKYDADDTPAKLLKSLQEQSIQSTSHHYMNLSEVQAQSELGMELMNHIMIFENYAVKELENEGLLNSKGEEGLSIESMDVFER